MLCFSFKPTDASVPEMTSCKCDDPPLSGDFGASVAVAPNMIDFKTIFLNFDPQNMSIIGLCSALILLYILGVIWARRRSKQDIIAVSQKLSS